MILIICIVIILYILLYFYKTKEHFNQNVENIINKLYIKSGGSGINGSNSAYIKYDNNEIIKRGIHGMNIIIIDIKTTKIKYNLNVDTGINYFANNFMIKLIDNIISDSDIVVISVKGDAFYQMNTECRFYLKKLGSKMDLTKGNSSYILIGSKNKQVYYERLSLINDVFFPSIKFYKIGCLQLNNNKIIKKISLQNSCIKFISLENLEKTGAMVAIGYNTNIFALTDNYLYILSKDYLNTNIGHLCYNDNELSVYKILEVNKKQQTFGIKAFFNKNFNGKNIIMEPGNYTNDFFNGIETEGGLKRFTIKSFKIPNDILVILYDNIIENIAKKYYFNGPTNIKTINEIKVIERIKIINTIKQILFFSNDGQIDVLTIGSHIITPKIINSIDIKLEKCVIYLYEDTDFKNLFKKIESKNIQKINNISNINYIKSIKIILF